MASGIFIVPILTIFGHIEIHTAIGASIVSVIACSCGAAAPFLKERLTNVRLAIVLETATTSGALTGVLLAGVIPVPYLYFLFAVILLLSAQQMLAKRGDPPVEACGDPNHADERAVAERLPWTTARGQRDGRHLCQPHRWPCAGKEPTRGMQPARYNGDGQPPSRLMSRARRHPARICKRPDTHAHRPGWR
jgi:hypothetical protein